MSLQIWLPLNGSLDNQGLSQATVTNSGATINNAGKIGKCYSFDGSDDYIALNSAKLYDIFTGGTQPFSIAMWIYHADATRAIVFGDYGLTDTINFNIELTTGHCIRFYWGNSPDKNFAAATAVAASGWTHIALTYSGSELLIYKNGVVQTDKWSGTLGARSKTSGDFYLGRDSRTGSTAFNGRLNDFRIYDHALSAEEVKKIAQGLILHYPLSSPSDVLVPSGYQQLEYLESTGTQYIDTGMKGNLNTAIEIKAKVNSNSTSQRLFGSRSSSTSNNIAFATSASQMTADFGNYNNTRLQATVGTNIFIAYNSASKRFIDSTIATTQYTTAFTTPSNLYLFDCYNGFGDGSWNGRVYYCKIWDGANIIRYFIPAKRLSDNVLGMYDVITKTFFTNAGTGTFTAGPNAPVSSPVYDISGFKNHGTIVGSLTVTAGSPRYKSCTVFPGNTSSYIQMPTLTLDWSKVSFSAWGNWHAFNNWSRIFDFGNAASGADWDICLANHSTNKNVGLGGRTGSGASWPDTQVTEKILVADTWYHLVETIEGKTCKLYIDGVLIKTITLTNTPTVITMTLNYLGKSNWSGNGAFNGSISDFRLFATVLSATEVAELYALGSA